MERAAEEAPISATELRALFKGAIFSRIACDSELRASLNDAALVSAINSARNNPSTIQRELDKNPKLRQLAQRLLRGGGKQSIPFTVSAASDAELDVRNPFVSNGVRHSPQPLGDDDVLTPEHVFALIKAGDLRLLKQFFNKPANQVGLWLADDLGYGALHMAVKYDKPEMVDYLLQRGIEVDGKSKYGKTPMMLACIENRQLAADVLLNYHPDLSLVDDKGVTALDYALSGGHTVLVETLLSHMTRMEALQSGKEDAEKVNFLKTSIDRLNEASDQLLLAAAAEPELSPLQTQHSDSDMQMAGFLGEIELLKQQVREREAEVRRLKRQIDQMDEALCCAVCLDARVASVVTPCYHSVMCHPCALSIAKQTKICPICSKKIAKVFQIFR